MSDRDALLLAIRTNPADDTPRLVYADWLDDHGEPDRAEFIRLQIALEPLRLVDFTGTDQRPQRDRRKELLRRERTLYRVNGRRWFEARDAADLTTPLRVGEVDWRVSRGFVGRLNLTVAHFLDRAADLFGRWPVEAVSLPGTRATGGIGFAGCHWRRAADSDPWVPASDTLPPVLFDLLDGCELPPRHVPPLPHPSRWYPGDDLAHADLSRACVSYGRRSVGLPPLGRRECHAPGGVL